MRLSPNTLTAIFFSLLLSGTLFTSFGTSPLFAQQVNIKTPFVTTNDDFFERIGTNFGFNLRGGDPNGSGSRIVGLDPFGNATPNGDIQFRQNSFGSAIPPFGGYDPGADATIGFGRLGDNADFFLGLAASQGSSRNIVSQTPSVTIPNGGQGTIIDTTQTPFVTGVVPVVGRNGALYGVPPIGIAYTQALNSRPSGPSPLMQAVQQYNEKVARGEAPPLGSQSYQRRTLSAQERGELRVSTSSHSTAEHGDLSVAELKRQHAAQQAAESQAKNAELAALIERARGAEAAGKFGAAKIYYRQAATRAEGELRQQLIERLQQLQ